MPHVVAKRSGSVMSQYPADLNGSVDGKLQTQALQNKVTEVGCV